MYVADFAALLAEESSKRGGQPLRIDIILSELDAKTRASVETALRDLSIKGNAIARALSKLGHDCGGPAVNKWRSRHCG